MCGVKKNNCLTVTVWVCRTEKNWWWCWWWRPLSQSGFRSMDCGFYSHFWIVHFTEANFNLIIHLGDSLYSIVLFSVCVSWFRHRFGFFSVFLNTTLTGVTFFRIPLIIKYARWQNWFILKWKFPVLIFRVAILCFQKNGQSIAVSEWMAYSSLNKCPFKTIYLLTLTYYWK